MKQSGVERDQRRTGAIWRFLSIGQRGAAAVEFALIVGPLAAMCMGILDFGWLYGQRLQMNQVAREASRLAAVNSTGSPPTTSVSNQANAIVRAACHRVGAVPGMKVSISRPNGNTIGAEIRVTASAPMHSMSGMYQSVLHDNPMTIRFESRIEQLGTWQPVTDATCS